MPVAHVSDEDFTAVSGASLEFQGADGRAYVAMSSASGAVRLDIPPGAYEVVVACPGYGPKLTRVTVGGGPPAQIRLLRDRLVGYVWPKAARAGERCELRVSSPYTYRAELWRCGAAREFVTHLGHGEHPPGATAQPTPDGDYCATGVGWNQTGLSAGPGLSASPMLLTAPERSGLYLVHVHARDGSTATIPWVVAPARPTADIAVLAGDITWNAYNSFGGRSNYLHAGGLPGTPEPNRRQTLPRYTTPGHEEWGHDSYPRLSFDRPEPENQIPLGETRNDPIQWRDACSLAAAEWRLLGWLEDSAFPYDLYAETQFARGDLDLSRYRVLVLNVHPEYWTVEMYEKVKRWVQEDGGKLVYLGGNGINCAVTLNGDDTMTVHNGNAANLEPRRSEVESRFGLHHEPEARLLGVGYTRAGLFTAAPYEVLKPDHWVFEGTGVREGELIGARTLNTRIPGGASGHETDKASPNSPQDTTVVARGTNPRGGGAEMALHHTASGGAVFAAGSINFVTALPVDGVLQRIVHNVLTRFLNAAGTQPRERHT
jgi:N,N-dimethylformamidase